MTVKDDLSVKYPTAELDYQHPTNAHIVNQHTTNAHAIKQHDATLRIHKKARLYLQLLFCSHTEQRHRNKFYTKREEKFKKWLADTGYRQTKHSVSFYVPFEKFIFLFFSTLIIHVLVQITLNSNTTPYYVFLFIKTTPFFSLFQLSPSFTTTTNSPP